MKATAAFVTLAKSGKATCQTNCPPEAFPLAKMQPYGEICPFAAIEYSLSYRQDCGGKCTISATLLPLSEAIFMLPKQKTADASVPRNHLFVGSNLFRSRPYRISHL